MKKTALKVRKAIKEHPRRIQVVILLLAAVLAALLVYLVFFRNTSPAAPPLITTSTDQPDETKPGNDFNWQGRPEDPKYIRIPAVGIEGYIQNVGVDQHQQVAVPNNVHMAGWFVESVRPGERGLSIIDGHVTGPSTDGIFKNLAGARPGDTYTIEFGNGTIKEFEILAITEVPAPKAAAQVFSQNPTQSHQVNLVTCGGAFDKTANAYENRVIVSSKLR